jgi:hypothetical protein
MRPSATRELETTIRNLQDAENRVALAEAALSAAKAYRQFVGEHEMTEAATAAVFEGPDPRTTGVVLSDGTEWFLEQKYHCSVDPQQRPLAFETIESATKGQALKRTITLSFDKGSYERVKLVRGMIREMLPQYEISLKVGDVPDKVLAGVTGLLESVGLDEIVKVAEGEELSGATMRSWVVKQLKLGIPVPDCFQVYAPVQALLAPMSIAKDEAALIQANQRAASAMVAHAD